MRLRLGNLTASAYTRRCARAAARSARYAASQRSSGLTGFVPPIELVALPSDARIGKCIGRVLHVHFWSSSSRIRTRR